MRTLYECTKCASRCPVNDPWRGNWFDTVTRWVDDAEIERRPIRCEGLYSDVLYRPFENANTPLRSHLNIPPNNQIARIGQLSAEEFEEKWYDKPFIATKVVNDWPVMQDWNWLNFANKCNGSSFTCEALDWSFNKYLQYMIKHKDESPLYLFDNAFVEKLNLKVGKSPKRDEAYWVPECFGVDYFDVLGAERPDHRWLIVGPTRSGSTFHKDPNGTRSVPSS